MNLKGRDLLSIKELTKDEIIYLLDLAKELKIKKKKSISVETLRGRNAAFIFERPGLFVRAAADAAAHDLGVSTTVFTPEETAGLSEEERADMARAFSGIYDAVLYRGYFQDGLEKFASVATIPVWNGGSTQEDPVQILADIMTIREVFGKIAGKKLVYLGNAGAGRAISLMTACAKLGVNYTACSPEQLFPDTASLGRCESLAEESGGSITLSGNITSVIRNADIIYTDSSQVNSLEDFEELKKFSVVTDEMLSLASEDVIYMQALPTLKSSFLEGEEQGVPAADIDAISRTFEQSENLNHVMKAVIAATLGAI